MRPRWNKVVAGTDIICGVTGGGSTGGCTGGSTDDTIHASAIARTTSTVYVSSPL